MSYTGYLLTESSRNKILELFHPKYEKVICHHITEQFGIDIKTTKVPGIPRNVSVIGYIDSGDGVEGLLVSVNGTSTRPDGKKYHITLSLAENRKPIETNNYVDLATKIQPFTILVVPKIFD